MRLRRFSLDFLAAGAMAAASLVPGLLLGQDAVITDQPMPPELPETRVEATPWLENYEQGGSILDGSLFDSPPTQGQGYRADSSTAGSIIDVPEADLPLTVNVVPRDVLDDQVVLRIDDIIRDAGGVTKAGDGLFGDRLFLRGIEVGSRSFRKDGFLDPTYVPRDFQNVERMEILKGPASVLYGSGDASGLVNVITKKPVHDTFGVFGYTFGSYNRSRLTVDANGLGNESGTVLYRINVAQEDANSFVDFDYLHRTQIAPVISWALDDSTSLTWNGEWHRHRTSGFQGTPMINGNPLYLPPNRYVGEPANDFLNTEEFRQSLVLRKDLGDGWWASIGASSLFYQFPGSTTSSAAQVNPVPPLIVRSRSDIPFEDEQSQSLIANLAGESEVFGMLHKPLVGLEYNYFDSASQFNSSVIPAPFDVDNPTYTDPAANPVFAADFPIFRQQRLGGYLQDLVEINENWKAMAGVRFDHLNQEFDRNIGLGLVATNDDYYRASPRAGLVYQPFADESLAFYYGYSQSFTPPGGGIYLFGNAIPILGEGHEAGVKTMIWDNLYLTVAGFHNVKRNEIFNVQTVFLTQVGEVTAQGAEANLVGEVTEYFSILANYTYTDARLSDPNPAFDNKIARNVPWNTANVWGRLDVLRNEDRRVGIGMGLVYVGERPGDLSNTFNLPGYTRWDGGLYYTQGQWNAGLYLENLFDLQYAQSSANANQIFQAAPFNGRAMITYTY